MWLFVLKERGDRGREEDIVSSIEKARRLIEDKVHVIIMPLPLAFREGVGTLVYVGMHMQFVLIFYRRP